MGVCGRWLTFIQLMCFSSPTIHYHPRPILMKGEAADYWPGGSPGSRACACAHTSTCSQVLAWLSQQPFQHQRKARESLLGLHHYSSPCLDIQNCPGWACLQLRLRRFLMARGRRQHHWTQTPSSGCSSLWRHRQSFWPEERKVSWSLVGADK